MSNACKNDLPNEIGFAPWTGNSNQTDYLAIQTAIQTLTYNILLPEELFI